MFPKNVNKYVEPFGGAFWNYLKGDSTIFDKEIEIQYNDFNPLLVNMYNCFNHPEKSLEYLKKIKPFDEEYFKKSRDNLVLYQNNEKTLDLSIPNFEVMREFVYVMTHIFSGVGISKTCVMCYPVKKEDFLKNPDYYIKTKGKYKAILNKLKNNTFENKLKKISKITNKDFQEVIEEEDSETTLFYLDPPYYGCEHYYSNHNFGKESHERMADALKKIKGKFIVSYYDFPELHELFPENEFHWERKEYALGSSATKGTSQRKHTEVLIMNYDPIQENNKTTLENDW